MSTEFERTLPGTTPAMDKGYSPSALDMLYQHRFAARLRVVKTETDEKLRERAVSDIKMYVEGSPSNILDEFRPQLGDLLDSPYGKPVIDCASEKSMLQRFDRRDLVLAE